MKAFHPVLVFSLAMLLLAAPVDDLAAAPESLGLGDITSQSKPEFPRHSMDGAADSVSHFEFTLTEAKKVGLALRQLDHNADLVLEDADGNVIARSERDGTTKEWISATLLAGTYYIKVAAKEAGANDYVLRYGTGEPDAAEVEQLQLANQQQAEVPVVPRGLPRQDPQMTTYGEWLTDMNLSGVHHWDVTDVSFSPTLVVDAAMTTLPTGRLTWVGLSKGVIEASDTRISGTMRAEFYVDGEWSTVNPSPNTELSYRTGLGLYIDGLRNEEGRALKHKKWEFGYVINDRWQVVGGVGVNADGSFAASKYGQNVSGQITGANHEGIAGTADFNTNYEGTTDRFRVNMIFSGTKQ